MNTSEPRGHSRGCGCVSLARITEGRNSESFQKSPTADQAPGSAGGIAVRLRDDAPRASLQKLRRNNMPAATHRALPRS